MVARKKMTREELLEKKRLAERLRYQRIKNDPEKYAQQKDKEKKKYQKKKEKGSVKTVDQMTPREQRKARKLWREKARKRRRRLQDISNAPMTPPTSDNEAPQLPPTENLDRRAQAGQRKAIRARKARNLLIRKQAAQIAQLKSEVHRYKKKLQRSTKRLKAQTPNSKVVELVKDTPNAKETVKKKLLFGEVISQQLKENFSGLSTKKERRVFKRVISGKLVEKYQIFDKDNDLKPLKKQKKNLTLIDKKRNARKNCDILKARVANFLEQDSNSRVCAGKKDFITKHGKRKQKRILLDSLLNLHSLFMKRTGIRMSYAFFCRLRPFYIVQPRCGNRNTCLCKTHSNMDLILHSLHQARIISVANHVGLLNIICCDRYNETCLSRNCSTCKNRAIGYKEFDNSFQLLYRKWQSLPQSFIDPKTKITQKVTRCVKSTIKIYPRDMILELECKLEQFLRHEFNIVHQYKALKSKKENLTETDAIIHVDFSENYQTKYAEEVQSFHFGGSRQQISMHTVVVYTKEVGGEVKKSCFCTLSKNLSHSPPAIWAHLQPILDSLPDKVNNLHFLSDGPVTQYHNKIMFHVLATLLQEFYPNLVNFTWNYHEAGHGKGAPDGVGATCKRTADRLVATGSDISSLEDLANALQSTCPNIKVFTIDDADILDKEAQIGTAKNMKAFPGTLQVHQVTGSVFLPNRLVMKSLSCFCDVNVCSHFIMGKLDYSIIDPKPRLHIEEVYGSKSESDDEPLATLISRQCMAKSNDIPLLPQPFDTSFYDNKRQGEDPQPSTSKKISYSNGNFVLVKLIHRGIEYRYVAMCTGVEEDDEVQVVFCKICDSTGKNFKIDENDISFITMDQILGKLPEPNLKMKGQRIFYAFNESVDVYERG